MIEEIAALRVIPNPMLVSPADPVSTKKMTRALVEHAGPAALRISNPAVPTVYRDDFPFELGKAVPLTEGNDATIISTGMMLSDALEAADTLDKEGIKVRLLDMHTLKPIDEEAVIKAARETGAIVTVEDSSIIGGLGGAVAEIVAEDAAATVKRVGIHDRFGQSGTVSELKEEYKISARDIAQAVRESIKKK